MKKIVLTTIVAISMTSCYNRIGDLTMMSSRNIDSSKEYIELQRYVKVKGKTLEDAMLKGTKDIPNAEYYMNIQIYVKNSGKVKIIGDVWGTK